MSEMGSAHLVFEKVTVLSFAWGGEGLWDVGIAAPVKGGTPAVATPAIADAGAGIPGASLPAELSGPVWSVGVKYQLILHRWANSSLTESGFLKYREEGLGRYRSHWGSHFCS